MKDSSDFGDVAHEFQSIGAPSIELVRAVEKGRQKLVRGWILGIALTFVLCGAAVFVLWRDHDAAAVVFAVMQIGIAVSTMAFVSYSQRHAWRARSETMRGFLELEIERRRDWKRRMRFLQCALPVVAAFVVAHQALVLSKTPETPTPGTIVTFGIPYAILGALFVSSRRRKARFAREEGDLMQRLAVLGDDAA
jgi:hypothetical protein